MRVGHGYDAHRLAEGRRLVIGGVEIPHSHGLAAHSDGDVLIHAVCDALLGAAALGDIGQHFPDSDPAYEGADSRDLLRVVGEKVRAAGYRVGNIDATIVAQAPKMAPHLETMRANIAAELDVTPKVVGVKATTTERLGFAGRGEGMAAHAVALLEDA